MHLIVHPVLVPPSTPSSANLNKPLLSVSYPLWLASAVCTTDLTSHFNFSIVLVLTSPGAASSCLSGLNFSFHLLLANCFTCTFCEMPALKFGQRCTFHCESSCISSQEIDLCLFSSMSGELTTQVNYALRLCSNIASQCGLL